MRPQIFSSGFRPTFLLAGGAALVLPPLWVAAWGWGIRLSTGWPPTLWHAHEMLFGFVGAAIAGFLLTAFPSWTGQRGFAGWPLAVLVSLWLCGRLLIATSRHWAAGLVLGVDAGFLVFLAVLVSVPLIRSRNRNSPLILVLGLLALCNAAFHLSLMRHDTSAASHSLLVSLDVILLMVTVIGGRILPAFTESGLRGSGSAAAIRRWPLVAPLAVATMAAVILVDAVLPNGIAAGIVAGFAAVVQFLRLAQWRSASTVRLPILWILHAGYAWIPAGLALKAAALLGGLAISAFWLHAFTVGALATMILAVMSRAALGHTGRPIAAAPLTICAYSLLLLAGVTRVFGLAAGLRYPAVIVLSASLFTIAFACFLWVYLPILWLPRADGKPG